MGIVSLSKETCIFLLNGIRFICLSIVLCIVEQRNAYFFVQWWRGDCAHCEILK